MRFDVEKKIPLNPMFVNQVAQRRNERKGGGGDLREERRGGQPRSSPLEAIGIRHPLLLSPPVHFMPALGPPCTLFVHSHHTRPLAGLCLFREV